MLKEQEDFLINEKSNENIDFKEGDWEMEPKEEIEGEGWEKESPAAHKAMLPLAFPKANSGLYRLSPHSGIPRPANWTRIW